MARIGARLLLETLLEAEVVQLLGRNRYERGKSASNARACPRNGQVELSVKTTVRRSP